MGAAELIVEEIIRAMDIVPESSKSIHTISDGQATAG
mgnify:CR=1 FL=1